MKSFLKRILVIIGAVIGLFLLYVGIVITHGIFTDYQPEEKISLETEGKNSLETVEDSLISLICWNIGFGGLGAKSTFFYDDGRMLTSGDKMVRSPKTHVDTYLKGIENFIQNTPVDFYLFQEVDRASKRSYFTNEYQLIQSKLPTYSSSFATNYKVARVPLPVLELWNVMGQMHSGLASFSKYQPSESTRFQFPGEYGLTTRIFQLDRCFLVNRYKVKNGKELVVINSHNSAYDNGSLKKQQMAYLKKYLLEEYEKGNYIIVGADWNQCPPNFAYDTFSPKGDNSYSQINISMDFLPEDWIWVYDPTTPTNRKLTEPYEAGKTFTTLIDFFLISPNLKLNKVRTIDQQFQFSDHQPVYMQVELQ